MTGPPLHFHEKQDDTFYVLEGLLTVQAGEEALDLRPGDLISIPPERRTFENVHNGDDLVRTVDVLTPRGHFPTIEDMARVPPGPEQPESIKEATRRHDTVIVGPPLRVTLGLALHLGDVPDERRSDRRSPRVCAKGCVTSRKAGSERTPSLTEAEY